jgi:hypothetical protein
MRVRPAAHPARLGPHPLGGDIYAAIATGPVQTHAPQQQAAVNFLKKAHKWNFYKLNVRKYRYISIG